MWDKNICKRNKDIDELDDEAKSIMFSYLVLYFVSKACNFLCFIMITILCLMINSCFHHGKVYDLKNLVRFTNRKSFAF